MITGGGVAPTLSQQAGLGRGGNAAVGAASRKRAQCLADGADDSGGACRKRARAELPGAMDSALDDVAARAAEAAPADSASDDPAGGGLQASCAEAAGAVQGAPADRAAAEPADGGPGAPAGAGEAGEAVPACLAALGRAPGGGPHLVFLGTGCAEPSKYRGASALHLRAAPGAGLLLDAGEGAWGALVRHYGERGAARQV